MSSSPVLGPMESSDGNAQRPWIKGLRKKASMVHSKVPYVNKLPFSAVAIIVFLILVNVAAWVIAIIALVRALTGLFMIHITENA